MQDIDAVGLAKRIIRRRMRDTIASMPADQRARASTALCDRVASLPEFAAARTIMLYLPMPGEADCTPLITRSLGDGRTVCVPKANWNDHSMSAVRLMSLGSTSLDSDEHGVRSPRVALSVPLNELDVIVVPGMAFDEDCCRLGRGGGFYDRFLLRIGVSTMTIGLAFEQQIVDQLPTCDHDVRMNMVMTDQRMLVRR